jgi:hypothetical protein
MPVRKTAEKIEPRFQHCGTHDSASTKNASIEKLCMVTSGFDLKEQAAHPEKSNLAPFHKAVVERCLA